MNINNGERLETYAIKGARGKGEICMNGPAARRVQTGDIVIIITYASMPLKKQSCLSPRLFFLTRKQTP